jgi:nicotinate phosphoribosyltransferase
MNISATYTDLYQLTMGQVYYLSGQHKQRAVFDYFFRKLPYQGGYVVFAGLANILDYIKELRFTNDDLDFLDKAGLHKHYLAFLKDFRFRGTIHSFREGDVVFPHVPTIRVEGTLLEAQLVETLLLNIINFQSLIATKASRIKLVAPGKILADFGLRRAQGLGGYHATRATIIGGFTSTSNVKAALDFGIPPSGTMAHSFIQHFDDELTAFRTFAEGRPDHCVLLVDTYDTLKSGIPNAITVAKEMIAKGQRLEAIRLDSGDLAYLSRRARHMLDEAGLPSVKIAASNQLDEYVIKSLLEQGAPIDIFGVGTSLVTGQPDAALDGVYKLCESDGKPRIKLSESIAKTTLPEKKQVYRIFERDGTFVGADAIALHDESPISVMHHPSEPDNSFNIKDLRQEALLEKVMENGEIVMDRRDIHSISTYSQTRLALLPQEYKRFQNPHTYKVGISSALRDLRDSLRRKYKD